MADPYDLQRFVTAQDPVLKQVLAELRAGRKTTHWMWFVFPQIAGLGRSGTARFYAIGSRAEARAYLSHPVLADRLRRCTEIVNGLEERSASAIFGAPDDMKFHSSITLFNAVASDEDRVFAAALDRYFDSRPDHATLDHL